MAKKRSMSGLDWPKGLRCRDFRPKIHPCRTKCGESGLRRTYASDIDRFLAGRGSKVEKSPTSTAFWPRFPTSTLSWPACPKRIWGRAVGIGGSACRPRRMRAAGGRAKKRGEQAQRLCRNGWLVLVSAPLPAKPMVSARAAAPSRSVFRGKPIARCSRALRKARCRHERRLAGILCAGTIGPK